MKVIVYWWMLQKNKITIWIVLDLNSAPCIKFCLHSWLKSSTASNRELFRIFVFPQIKKIYNFQVENVFYITYYLYWCHPCEHHAAVNASGCKLKATVWRPSLPLWGRRMEGRERAQLKCILITVPRPASPPPRAGRPNGRGNTPCHSVGASCCAWRSHTEVRRKEVKENKEEVQQWKDDRLSRFHQPTNQNVL